VGRSAGEQRGVPDGVEIAEIDVDVPARIVIGFGSVWVTDSGSSLVHRMGPVQS
jgi:hypothetical protein